MNIGKLFDTQRNLDKHIKMVHPIAEGENRLSKKILALQVELGELANEWRGFKFWSDDKEPRTKLFTWIDGSGEFMKSTLDLRFINNNVPCNFHAFREVNPLLEEYVDCLHFILSIGLEYEVQLSNLAYITSELEDTVIEQLIVINTVLTEIYYTPRENIESDYRDLIGLFIGLGEMLGFAWDQIEEAYYIKNSINHERQNTGY